MGDRIQLAFAITRAREVEDGLLVEGILLDEQLDKYGKIIDYARSRPFIEAWRDEIRAISGGKSDGNVRVMHQLWPAGVVVPDGLLFDDAAKEVRARVKVVEPDAKALVLEGVLTTFSVGADVKERWKDAVNPKIERLAIAPVEMSLVDNPGQYRHEGFEVTRANGAVETVPFKIRPKIGAATLERARALRAKVAPLVERLRAGGATDATPLARPEAVRGMWHVGRLASLLQELDWLTSETAAERDYEGDASSVPERLGELVVELGDVLVVMAAEEVAELTERFQPEMAESLTTLAAGAPEPALARAIQALAVGGDVLRTQLHPRIVRRAQRMHDWLCELGAMCGADDDEMTERAATPSAPVVEEDDMDLKELLAAGPELARAMGIGDTVDRAVKPVTEAVEGVKGDVAELKRTVEAQAETIKTQDERLKAVEAQPEPPTGVTRVVTKDADGNEVKTPPAVDPDKAEPLDVMRAVISRQPIGAATA